MMSVENLQRTPLYECHKRCGAKFVPFGGWDMPVQYSGVIDEHNTVRNAAGLFDVSHMGEISVRGKEAIKLLQYLTSNDLSKTVPGRAQYSFMLNERGGVVDDIITYCIAPDDYLICVNASNANKDFDWILKNNNTAAVVENLSASYAQLAIQGPKATSILAKVFAVDVAALDAAVWRPFSFRNLVLKDRTIFQGEMIVARTGYTGEDGFEVFCPANIGSALWDLFLEAGQGDGLKPIGLGARDTLRLEACLPLHGHELSDEICALSCGFPWVIKFDKGEFIGAEALKQQQQAGVKYQLIGMEVLDAGIVRDGAKLFAQEREVGWSSSGTKTPTLNKAIALGFVEKKYAEVGTELSAEVRGKQLKVRVVKTPFYKRPQ